MYTVKSCFSSECGKNYFRFMCEIYIFVRIIQNMDSLEPLNVTHN